MGTRRKLAALKEAYVRFADGQPQGFLELLAPDAGIVYAGPPNQVPWAGRYEGPEGFRQMLAGIGEHMEIREFRANRFIADGDHVVVLGLGRGVARASGAPYDADWAHYIRFRDDAISELQIYIDTAAIAAAITGR